MSLSACRHTSEYLSTRGKGADEGEVRMQKQRRATAHPQGVGCNATISSRSHQCLLWLLQDKLVYVLIIVST